MSEPGFNRLRLGLDIRRWRHGRRLTQAELAAKLGCRAATISEIERGKRNISVNMLFACCRALDCKVTDLLVGVE